MTKRFLHRMGFILSPSLLGMGIGPYNNPVAIRNWRKVNERADNLRARRMEARKDELEAKIKEESE